MFPTNGYIYESMDISMDISMNISMDISICWSRFCFHLRGNLRPLIIGGYLKKVEKFHLEKYGWAFFPNVVKRGMFSKHFEKIPPPPGAAAPGGRRRRRRQGYFFKICENRPLFSKYLEKMPIHVFLNDTFHFFK